MNHLNYEIALNDTCEQQLQVLKRGCCSSLAKGSFYMEGDVCNVSADVCALFHLNTFLMGGDLGGERFESSSSFYKNILGWLRKITEALLLAEEYLILEHALSMRLEDIYFESEEGCAILLLKPSEKGFFEGLCTVCDEIFKICPQSNADIIRNRLESQNAKSLLSMQDLLRLLSSWACEMS